MPKMLLMAIVNPKSLLILLLALLIFIVLLLGPTNGPSGQPIVDISSVYYSPVYFNSKQAADRHDNPKGNSGGTNPLLDLPVILAWTPFVANKMMQETLLKAKGWTNKIAFVPFDQSKCRYRCIYTDDRSYTRNASIIVFHIYRRAHQNFDPKDLPPQNPNRLNVFFRTESPMWYSDEGDVYKKLPPDYFNITMSYSKNSDIFVPYDKFEKIVPDQTLKREIWQWDKVLDKVKRKSKLALQVVSHCHTSSGREQYVQELRKFINITELGSCHKTHTPINESMIAALIEEHMFYLAFENAVCNFYVTEKFWNVKKLIVPIVLSREPMKGLKIPRDSYISASDFSGVKDLANYLIFLQQHPAEYLRYFEWTKKYKMVSGLNPLCELCQWAVENRHKEAKKNAAKWFEEDAQCVNSFVVNVLFRNQRHKTRK